MKPNPNWVPAPRESTIILGYKPAPSHLPRKRRRKMNRIRLKLAIAKARRALGYPLPWKVMADRWKPMP